MIVKNVENKENNTVHFQVQSDAAEFEAAVNSAYLKNKANINIPGFRKGKAPRAIIEGMYGREAFYQDAMDDLAPKAYEFAMEQEKFNTVGSPSIVDVKVTDERAVEYTFAVALYPEVALGQYKGLEAEKSEAEVTDEEVDAELKSERDRNSRLVSVDDRPAQLGDTVSIDFDGYLNGERFDGGKAEGYSLELGSGSFVPGFEEQVVGMTIGQEKDIDVTFPEHYVENLAGKAVVFKIRLNEISFKELPELDDEFAKDVSGFDTLDEYKADIRAGILKRHQEEADAAFRSDIMRQACANMTADVPEVMILERMEQIIRNYAANFGMTDRNMEIAELAKMLGLDDNTLNSSIRPAAEFQVKSDLLLEAVAKAEGIELTEEETEAYIAKTAESMQIKPEDLKQYFGAQFIAEEQKKEKASAIIMDSAVAKAAESAEEKTPAKKAAKKAAEPKEAAEGEEEKKPAKKAAKKTAEGEEEKKSTRKPAKKAAEPKTEE